MKKSYRIIFVSFLMVLFVWLYMFRKPYDGEGFILSDATYHVLLTMEAYEETPVYVHRYLPIQSLGGEYNKGIVNGSSIIMDDVGNNYYVSFSSLGFLAPYLFCKLLRLGLTIDSLYLFNSVIMFLCAIITAAIVYSLFHNEIIAYTGAVIYLFMPEIMYTQGIVYWHHSLSQLFLGIQLLLFVMLYVNNVHKCRLLMKIVFYVVAFLYAYNEWTGYVSNVGVALGIIILNGIVTKKKGISLKKEYIIDIFILAMITIAAFAYFLFGFSDFASLSDIIYIMTTRAQTRGGTINESITGLLHGYWESFGSLIVLDLFIGIFTLSNVETRRLLFEKLKSRKMMALFWVCLFLLVENVVLISHAIYYTFDRLKMAFILIIVMALLLSVLEGLKDLIWKSVSVVVSVIAIVCGYFLYSNNNNIVTMPQYNDSVALRDYLYETYYNSGKSVLAKEGWRAWGYVQTFYHRNMYCTMFYPEDMLVEIAKNKNERYVVIINGTDYYGDTAIYKSARVIDTIDNCVIQVTCDDGKIIKVQD